MRTARRESERAAQRHPEETPLRIERVEEWEEIILVRAAAMEEHEQTGRLAGCGPGAANQRERVGAQDVLQQTTSELG